MVDYDVTEANNLEENNMLTPIFDLKKYERTLIYFSKVKSGFFIIDEIMQKEISPIRNCHPLKREHLLNLFPYPHPLGFVSLIITLNLFTPYSFSSFNLYMPSSLQHNFRSVFLNNINIVYKTSVIPNFHLLHQIYQGVHKF